MKVKVKSKSYKLKWKVYWKCRCLNVVKYENETTNILKSFRCSEISKWKKPKGLSYWKWKVRVKNEWKVKVKSESEKLNIGFNEVERVDQNKLTNIHVNLLIFDWQKVDHEDIFKKLIWLTWWKWKWKVTVKFK